MANTITPNTVCRAVSGLIREKTVDAFVRIGGDYRSEQKSCVQKLMNWLAQCFDKNYATRTLSEVNYKKKALGSDFQGFATQVLKAKLADDYTVCIPFEIDNQQLEIVSYPANPKKLYVRHQWTDTELEGVHLATLKSILLKEYIDLQKKSEYETGLINLTEFELLGLDLREMDFTGCSLPDLVRCRLSGIKFDRSTNFNSGRRKMCEIDDVTLDRLHQHKLSSRELVVQEFSDGVREGGTCTDHFTYPDDQKPSTYNYGQIFNSDNLDLATIKRFHLQYDRKGIVKCFKEMRQNGIPINLAHVDLSGLDLSKMDLSGVNLYGANLTGANLNNTSLNSSDLRNAFLLGTDMCDAVFLNAKVHRTKIDILIRGTHQKQVIESICGQYDKSKIISKWLDKSYMEVRCTEN